jgi:hypothetical protein
MRASCPEIPVVINGKEHYTGDIEHQARAVGEGPPTHISTQTHTERHRERECVCVCVGIL